MNEIWTDSIFLAVQYSVLKYAYVHALFTEKIEKFRLAGCLD